MINESVCRSYQVSLFDQTLFFTKEVTKRRDFIRYEKYGTMLKIAVSVLYEPKMGLAGMIAAGTMATGAVAVTVVCVPFVTPALRKICIPYVPATPQQLQNVAMALSTCPAKVSPLVDLGSGDGRVV
ncbi:CG3337-PA, putative, partial [Brugia malayi]